MTTPDTPFVQRTVLAIVIAAMVACAWIPALDTAANRQVDAGLKRALISFATARTLNAVISVAQGTQLAIEPAGVGLAFSIGEVLDPVNDLVEQFSSLMLVASVAFGIQKVLISIGAHRAIALLLTVVAIGWAIFYLRGGTAPPWLTRILVVVLMIRFAIPVVTVGTDLVFQNFLAEDYQASQRMIDTTSTDIGKLSATDTAIPPPNQSALDRFRNWWSQNGDGRSRFDSLKLAAEQAIDHIIKLIVIFILETLFIPLLLLWVLYGVVRRTLEQSARVT